MAAYVTGVLAAVPAGPVQIEVIRRTINGHIRTRLLPCVPVAFSVLGKTFYFRECS
jgi:hypothetical protein